MADVAERVALAREALLRFGEALDARGQHDMVRDSAILRFVFGYETAVAAARHYLYAVDLDANAAPGAVIRACKANGLIDAAQTEGLLAMGRDRNRAVHAYDEALAEELLSRLPGYRAALQDWLSAIESRLSSPRG